MDEESIKPWGQPKMISYDCGICLDAYPPDKVVIFSCNHYFCRDCVGQFRDDRCPYCRADISVNLTEENQARIKSCQREDRNFDRRNDFRLLEMIPAWNHLFRLAVYTRNVTMWRSEEQANPLFGADIPEDEIRLALSNLF